MKKQIPEQCKTCKMLWTKGIKDQKHNMWCCKYANPAWKAISHCKLNNGYEENA